MERIEPSHDCFLLHAGAVGWRDHIYQSALRTLYQATLVTLHDFPFLPSTGILKTWFGTPGLATSNIDLSKTQRTFPTDQRKSGLPKVLPAYKNGLKPKQSSKSTKSTVEDFKRKRTKVGRKVKKNNVTTIKVQSKRINIPLQSNLDGSHSQKDVFARILRQFSHHSSQTRVAALEDLKSFLKSVAHPESYIALFFPSAMELLFDDERETRKALLVILSSVLGRFSSRCFASISSLIITYLCSGLTSLHKGIRRDSLNLALVLVEVHPQLVISHATKVLGLVISLLVESSQSNNENINFVSSKDSKVLVEAAEKQKQGKLLLKKQSNVLVTALQFLGALALEAEAAYPLKATKEFTSPGDVCVDDRWADGSSGMVVLRSIKRKCAWLSQSRERATASLRIEDQAAMSPGGSIPHFEPSLDFIDLDVAKRMCQALSSIWSGLVLDSSVLANDVVAVLQEMIVVSSALGRGHHISALPEFSTLMSVLFSNFPHSSLEASLAVPNSTEERTGNRAVEMLDLSIAQLSLTAMSNHARVAASHKYQGGTGPLEACGGAAREVERRVPSTLSQTRVDEYELAAAHVLGKLEQLLDHIASADAGAGDRDGSIPATSLQSADRETVEGDGGDEASLDDDDDNDDERSAVTADASGSATGTESLTKSSGASTKGGGSSSLKHGKGRGDRKAPGRGTRPKSSKSQFADHAQGQKEEDFLSSLFECVQLLLQFPEEHSADLVLSTPSGSTAHRVMVALQGLVAACLEQCEARNRQTVLSSGLATGAAHEGARLPRRIASLLEMIVNTATIFVESFPDRSTSTREQDAHLAAQVLCGTLKLVPNVAQELTHPVLTSKIMRSLLTISRSSADDDRDGAAQGVTGVKRDASGGRGGDDTSIALCVASLFRPSARKDRATVPPSAHAMPMAFSQCPPGSPARRLMLDMLLYTSFPTSGPSSLISTARAIGGCLVAVATPIDEQAHFLQLLFRRRRDVSAFEFVELLFSFLRKHVRSVAASWTAQAARGGATSVSVAAPQGLASEIAQVLWACSSSEAPEKFLEFITAHLESFVDAKAQGVFASTSATRQPVTDFIKAPGRPGGGGAAAALVAEVQAKAIALCVVCEKLFRAWGWMNGATGQVWSPSSPTEGCTKYSDVAIDVITTITNTVAGIAGRCLIEQGKDEGLGLAALRRTTLRTITSVLSLRGPRSSSSSSKPSDNQVGSFPLVAALLGECLRVASTVTKGGDLLAVVRAIKLLVQKEELVEAVSYHKASIATLVGHISERMAGLDDVHNEGQAATKDDSVSIVCREISQWVGI